MDHNGSTLNIEIEKYIESLIDNEWNLRSFSNEKVSPATILQIFDSARAVTSSYNYKEQPWIGILANREDESFNQLFNCLDLFNQKSVETVPCLGVILEKR